MDGTGAAYSGNLLGTSLTSAGVAYTILPANQKDVVKGISAPVIPLPSGTFSSLAFLGTGLAANQLSQVFTVTYTDGTTTAFTQSLSDWFTPQSYPGEAIARAMPYRNLSTGAKDNRTFNLYQYGFALNSAKTVKSLTLPSNANVAVVAITLTGGGSGTAAATPTFSPAAGTYSSTQTVSILDSTPNASIFYTTNGSPASTSSTPYTGPIQVSTTETIRAVAIASGFTQSAEGVASYTIGTTCTAPSTPGVNVCSPVNGSTVSSPVSAQAKATITGTLARMEVWVDGVKKFTETTSTTLSTSITLATGSHRFDFYAVNTAGTKWLTTVNATVK
jgi:hypothetical protein